MPPRSIHRAAVAALASALAATSLVAHADEAELARRIEQLAAQLDAVKAELARLKQATATTTTATTTATATTTTTATAAPAAAVSAAASTPPPTATAAAEPPAAAERDTVLTSYGEINLNRPVHHSEQSEADVRRVVLGYQHRFDARTKAAVELEWEHGVVSSSDAGETEVEQAYVERALTPQLAVRGGLFLVPAGLLNENHEPTTYYGVERNFVETAIIPSTWREGGVQAIYALDNGLTVQGGVSTSFNLARWDATSTDGRTSPLGAIHQELSKAKAKDLALFGAANWRGVPGLLVGASAFAGGVGQGQPGTPNAHVLLWDVHARYTPGAWDFAALVARGTLSRTAAFNTPLVGSVALVPSVFEGGYLQAAYRARVGEFGIAPFGRIERFNTAKKYDALGAGLTPIASPTERVITLGVNVDLDRSVVVKTDYQWFTDSARNRVDLGLGWSF